MTKTKIKEFWDAQAEEHGPSDLATAPDHHYRTLEVSKIKEMLALEEFKTLLDVGCGNGYSTLEFARRFPEVKFTGVDYSEKMIEAADAAAREQGIDNVEFFHGDVLSLSRNKRLSGNYDVVLSERCLINLANWPEQKLGILEMRKMLAPAGRLMLVENTKRGLENLNVLREDQGLEPIKVRWHNNYLPDDDLAAFLQQITGKLLTPEYVENIGNNYYLMSRVVYAKLAQMEGKEPDYNHPINAIASKMPTFGDFHACSPNFMFILRNVEERDAPWENNQKPS